LNTVSLYLMYSFFLSFILQTRSCGFLAWILNGVMVCQIIVNYKSNYTSSTTIMNKNINTTCNNFKDLTEL
jgi:hypothetical protein